MSRVFLAAILAVLLGLLGVMANIVSPKPKAADTVDKSKMQEMQKKAQTDDLANRQAEMKQRMKMETAINTQAEPKPRLPKRPETAKLPMGKTHKQTGMQITPDWFESRPDGAAGIKKLEEDALKEKQSTPPQPPAATQPK